MNLRRFPRIRAHFLRCLRPVGIARDRLLQPFVFIHINKTGGQSVGHALGARYEHKTAREKRRELGDRYWNAKFKFAFVRNPWDKVVSEYHYRIKTNQNDLGVRPVSFEEWLQRVFLDRDPMYRDSERMFQPQFEWLRDEAGNCAVDFVGRFENLGSDFQVVCERIGRRASLPHVNRSTHRQFTELYDERTEAVVAEAFRVDCERFGYRFSRLESTSEVARDPS